MVSFFLQIHKTETLIKFKSLKWFNRELRQMWQLWITVNKEKWTTRTCPPWQNNYQTQSDLSHYNNCSTDMTCLKTGLFIFTFLPLIPQLERYCLLPQHTMISMSHLPHSRGNDIWNVLMLQHGWPDLDIEKAFKQEWMYSSSGQGDTHCLMLHLFNIWCIEADSLMHSIGRLDDGIVQPHKRGQR